MPDLIYERRKRETVHYETADRGEDGIGVKDTAVGVKG